MVRLLSRERERLASLASWKLLPMMRNSVLVGLRVRRFADIQSETEEKTALKVSAAVAKPSSVGLNEI